MELLDKLEKDTPFKTLYLHLLKVTVMYFFFKNKKLNSHVL